MHKSYRPYMRFGFNNKIVYHSGRTIPIRNIKLLGVKNYFFDDTEVFGTDKALLKMKKRLTFVYHHWYKFLNKKEVAKWRTIS